MKSYIFKSVVFMVIITIGAGVFLINTMKENISDINTRQIVTTMPRLPDLGGVLEVFTNTGNGSCFVIAKKGNWYYAITAAHVVDVSGSFGKYPDFSMGPNIKVDKERYYAEIVRVGSKMDIALIRFLSDEKYPIYKISRAKVGESCITIGWSRGAFLQYKGYVVSLNYKDKVMANGGIVPGCSGGPLMNAKGEVIGVTISVPIYSRFGYDSSSLHVPAKYIDSLIITIGE